MEKSKFLREVKTEIDHIKKHATEKEKSILNNVIFNHRVKGLCIYGQMTGICDSKRARELYPKTYRYYTYNEDIFINLPKIIFGPTSFRSLSFKKGTVSTALEKYLYVCGKDIRFHIIDYIKDDTNTIKLNLK